MMPTADPLAGLRGYHLPEAVSWWPPTPGWWLFGGLLLALLVVLGWQLARRRRRRAAARAAARELAQLRATLSWQHDTTAFVRGLSRLLRRYVLVAFPQQRAAALTGEDWLAFLDRHGGDGRFQQGPGRRLLAAPYQPGAADAVDELAALVADWIARNREVRR
jgi:hypothetical protein